MNAIGYYLFYGINWLITLLPLRFLYIFSNFFYILLYYFPSYRRKVVRTNLVNAFPEKSIEEIIRIEKQFYSHLADLFVEIMKLTHMSEKELRQRFVINNLDLLDRLYEKNKDIIAIMAHYNNWEWPTILSPQTRYKTISIYKPLHNKRFNDLINSYRTRFGMVLTPMQAIVRELVKDRTKGINTLSAFINDQTPPVHELKHWVKFLNQDTPMFMGAEKIASRYDMSIVYFHIVKIKRGYYQLNIELLFENTAGIPEDIITEKHVRYLENMIREQPQYWIWSHRRWKHKKPAAND